MSRTAIIHVRIDPEIKAKAQEILDQLQISMSDAISLYLTQVTLQKGIPFDLKIPDEPNDETTRKSEKEEDNNQVNTGDGLCGEFES